MVNQQILISLNEMLDKTERKLAPSKIFSIPQKIASALLVLHKINKNNKEIIISNHELAKLIGISPEMLFNHLSEFKNQKLIKIKDNKITIINPKGLSKYNKTE
ncbi:MAG: winged helix-turn-helix domain-containing protein [Ignavibacteriales bacterium]|nr:winged helix-turn-helix domain-containing protein [Ignavibacteriales bacterium]